MKRALLLALCFFWTTSAQAGEAWDRWWHNADQRGEQLLEQGDATAAARTFSDPRRKAFAELQAGQYQEAARDFANFDDGDGNYNRGNALAQAGQLAEAIRAYDAALARDPNNQDARHNRDLVKQALQKLPPQSASDSSSKDSQKSNNKGQTDQAGSKDSGKQGDASKESSGQNQAGKEQQGKTGQGKEAGNGNANANAGHGQQQSGQSNQSSSRNQPAAATRTSGRNQSDDAAQARQDAAAALGNPSGGDGGKAASADAPASEQQLAQEQWLRRIPDDPGGLLRRKFLIEHMIRHQGGQQ